MDSFSRYEEIRRLMANEMEIDEGDTSTDTSSSSEEDDEEAISEWIKRSKAKLERSRARVGRVAAGSRAGVTMPIKLRNLIITKVVKMERAGTKNIFRCNYDLCQKILTNKKEFQLHLVAHSGKILQLTLVGLLQISSISDMTRPFVCKTCGLRQFTAKNLKAHAREHERKFL